MNIKALILILLIGVALIFYLYFSQKITQEQTATLEGNSSDLQGIIKKLMYSINEGSYVIVKVSDTESFLQFTGDKKGIQLDFPMLTEVQQQHKNNIIKVGNDLGLLLIENKGTDGSLFLDFNIHGSAEQISEIIKTFLTEVFKAGETSKLTYEYYGFQV